MYFYFAAAPLLDFYSMLLTAPLNDRRCILVIDSALFRAPNVQELQYHDWPWILVVDTRCASLFKVSGRHSSLQ